MLVCHKINSIPVGYEAQMMSGSYILPMPQRQGSECSRKEAFSLEREGQVIKRIRIISCGMKLHLGTDSRCSVQMQAGLVIAGFANVATYSRWHL